MYLKKDGTMENESVPWYYTEYTNRSDMSKANSNEAGMLYVGIKIICYVAVLSTAILLNIIVLFAYIWHLKKSTYIFSTVLSLCAVISCLVEGLDLVELLGKLPPAHLRLLCLIQDFFTHFGIIVSAGLVFCIALDRFLRIKYIHMSLSCKQSVCLSVAIVLAAFVVMTPYIIVHAFEMIQTDEHCLSYKHTHYAQNASKTSSRNRILTAEVERSRRLFLIPFYGVITGCLGLAFIAITFLYIKLVCVLMKKANDKVPKLNLASEISGNSLSCEEGWSSCTSSMESLSTRKSKKSRVPFRKDRVNCSDDLSTFVRDGSFKKKLETQNDRTSENVLIAVQKRQSQKEACLSRSPRNSGTGPKRKSLTLSIASVSMKTRRFSRTLMMLVMSLFVFLFYFPAVVIHIIIVLDESFTTRHYILSEFLQHSQVVCFLANPVIYAYFNRGFSKKLSSCCCCCSSRPVTRL